MSNIDYKFKAHILNEYSDLLLVQSKASRLTFSKALLQSDGIVNYTLEHANDNDLDLQELDRYCAAAGLTKELKECKRLNDSFYKRNKRLHDRVQNIVKNGLEPVFCTLTFNDDVIANTTQETRRKYVSRFLKDNCNKYVANIDFGIDERYTQREHYHAVVDTRIKDTWQYGFAFYERVRVNQNKTTLHMSKYITKLSNHAIKEQARRSALIYSR